MTPSTTLPAPDLVETDCPICHCGQSSQVAQVVDNVYHIPGTYHVCRCSQCRHLFMNPRPTAETLHLCYPAGYGPHRSTIPAPTSEPAAVTSVPWYLRYLPLRHVPGLKSFYQWLTEDLGQPLPTTPPSVGREGSPTALELGCATGQYLSRLRDAGWDVTGIEPSEAASRKAVEAGFRIHRGVLDDFEISEQAFDSVTAWMVVEHTIDPVTTLKKFFQLLKPGGQILISIPNAGCWEPFVFRSAWYLWEAPRHLHHFSPAQIRELLANAGYTDIRILHQRNVLNIVGSLGIACGRFRLTGGLGNMLLCYPESPNMWIKIGLSPIAHLLSWCRQGGRLTVSATRPLKSDSTRPDSLQGKS